MDNVKNTKNMAITVPSSDINNLADMIINDPESKMRVAIKAIEELVKAESKFRRINAPLTTEEKVLFNY